MTYDNFTIKAQESILKSQQIAAGLDQQQVDTVHLIKGILETDESVAGFLLGKSEVNLDMLRRKLDEAILKYPKVQGSDKQFLTTDANKSLSRAKVLLKEFGDQYISVELMLLGIVQGDDSGAKLLKELGANEQLLKDAINELRKGRKVTDQNSEDSYNTLAQNATNLNERAADV